ncbi:hypothetical protein GRI89_08835 [Altererythrobacter salegens]|uniref:Lipoprotein n=1 Tax=Croceibacterium salegens TaxID=1737568 RepID=A0A6I4SU86_9SPHN|nr:hypothetical protein [Croceibacterium salegens]MXO59644.1 hypothetical protein [Croceibacterium salegens]
MAITRMILLAPLALAACGPNVPGESAESSATAINAMLPDDLGAGAIITTASSDGNLLILNVVNMLEIESPDADKVTADSVRRFACRDATYKMVTAKGIEIRFDLTGTSGRKLPSVMLDKCPQAA